MALFNPPSQAPTNDTSENVQTIVLTNQMGGCKTLDKAPENNLNNRIVVDMAHIGPFNQDQNVIQPPVINPSLNVAQVDIEAINNVTSLPPYGNVGDPNSSMFDNAGILENDLFATVNQMDPAYLAIVNQVLDYSSPLTNAVGNMNIPNIQSSPLPYANGQVNDFQYSMVPQQNIPPMVNPYGTNQIFNQSSQYPPNNFIPQQGQYLNYYNGNTIQPQQSYPPPVVGSTAPNYQNVITNVPSNYQYNNHWGAAAAVLESGYPNLITEPQKTLQSLKNRRKYMKRKPKPLVRRCKKTSMRKNDNLPFLCGVCRKRFRLINHLKTHYAIHSEKNKTFQCPECDKTCCYRGALYLHMRTHSAQRARMGLAPLTNVIPSPPSTSSAEDVAYYQDQNNMLVDMQNSDVVSNDQMPTSTNDTQQQRLQEVPEEVMQQDSQNDINSQIFEEANIAFKELESSEYNYEYLADLERQLQIHLNENVKPLDENVVNEMIPVTNGMNIHPEQVPESTIVKEHHEESETYQIEQYQAVPIISPILQEQEVSIVSSIALQEQKPITLVDDQQDNITTIITEQQDDNVIIEDEIIRITEPAQEIQYAVPDLLASESVAPITEHEETAAVDYIKKLRENQENQEQSRKIQVYTLDMTAQEEYEMNLEVDAIMITMTEEEMSYFNHLEQNHYLESPSVDSEIEILDNNCIIDVEPSITKYNVPQGQVPVFYNQNDCKNR